MTLFINRTGHRDTRAIHAKIDELLRTQGKARAELTTLDERDVEDIEETDAGIEGRIPEGQTVRGQKSNPRRRAR
jgi:low affinity Fe/Cu permease